MFTNNKYSIWYYNIINNAESQARKKLKRSNSNFIYYESHHIIPKCIGGTKKVLLTAKEHFICHLLLCKMTTGTLKHKMINALIKMSFAKSKGQERYTSRSYSLVKKLIDQKNSEKFKGKPKSLKMRKALSKARKGMKFSDSHKANISKSVIARNLIGERNPFYGKHHTDETKQKWSKTRKQNAIAMGWYNDGNKSYFIAQKNANLNWKKGMLKKWYNNGIISKMLEPHLIPEGFIPGRIGWKH